MKRRLGCSKRALVVKTNSLNFNAKHSKGPVKQVQKSKILDTLQPFQAEETEKERL